MQIVFMGTPDFAVGALEALIAQGHEITAVVTQPDKAKGRSGQLQFPPVKECAVKHGIPVFQPRRIKTPEAIEELKKYVDSLIIVSNDNLLDVIGRKPIEEAFQAADNVLRQGVQTISDLIAVPALVNLDFADVRSVMQNQGRALIGIGMAEGEDKAISAAEKAIQSPLLEAQISGAKSAIVNITGGDKVSLFDAQNAVAVIQDAAGGDVDCIFGIAINEQLGDAIIVTVIATGFEEPKEKQRKRRSEPVIKQVANDTLFTEPKIQAPVNPGVVTSVENNTSDDEQIPNFFFNR